MNKVDDHKYSIFLNLAMKNQSQIFGFIMRLIPNFTVAEDILQETMLIMWQKFSEFREGTDFLSWAKQIARYKVMDYVRKSSGQSVVCLSDDLIEKISTQTFPGVSHHIYDEALHNCVDKLKGYSRELVRLRYVECMKIKDIAGQYTLSCNTLAKQMSRIHHALQKCVVQTLKAWEMSNG